MPRWHPDGFPFARHLRYLTFEDPYIPIGCENREDLAILHRGEVAWVAVPCPVYRCRDFMFVEQRREKL